MERFGVWCVLACAVSLVACSGAPEPVDQGQLELATPQVQGAAHLFAEAERLIERGDREGAERACLLVRDAARKEAASKEEAFEAGVRDAFCAAEIARLEWEALALDAADASEMRGAIQNKIKGMQSVVRGYQEIYAMKEIEWTLAAGTRVGDVYVHFAQSIEAAPAPAELDPESASVYRAQLEEVAAPLYQQAAVQYAGVVAKADELGLEGRYVARAREMSAAYPRAGAALEEDP
jgi:hypothetical protein